MHNRAFIIMTLLLMAAATSFAQTIDRARLDSLFDALQVRKLANATIVISVNGRMAYERAVGFARLDSNAELATGIATEYHIGSVTKMFTAVMIFQLIEAGKLHLEDPLSKYFPQLPPAQQITIKDMLYHRSGLHDYTHSTNFASWMDKPQTHEEMLQRVASHGSDFPPDSIADYCNTNYLLLGYIIEKMDATTYGQALQKRILSPAGLRHTYFGLSGSQADKEAQSYKYGNGRWVKEKQTDPTLHGGAGSIVSTAEDLVVFIHRLFTGHLVSAASLNQMKTMIDGYGMGMFPFDVAQIKGYGHNGRIEEFYAAVHYYPERKMAISYITNGILYPRSDIIKAIESICFHENDVLPFASKVDLPDTVLQHYAGTYSSGMLPFDVVCKITDHRLIFEIPGRSMTAEPVKPGYFMNLETGSFFEFDPTAAELQIKETDNVYELHRNEHPKELH